MTHITLLHTNERRVPLRLQIGLALATQDRWCTTYGAAERVRLAQLNTNTMDDRTWALLGMMHVMVPRSPRERSEPEKKPPARFISLQGKLQSFRPRCRLEPKCTGSFRLVSDRRPNHMALKRKCPKLTPLFFVLNNLSPKPFLISTRHLSLRWQIFYGSVRTLLRRP